MFTIGNWVVFICLVVVALISIFLSTAYFSVEGGTKSGMIAFIVTFLISIGIIGGYMGYAAWYHTSTASGIRDMKDYKSELENGIDRHLVIKDQNNMIVYEDSGKFDIETTHLGENYIVYEKNGKRVIYKFGMYDRAIIEEN